MQCSSKKTRGLSALTRVILLVASLGLLLTNQAQAQSPYILIDPQGKQTKLEPRYAEYCLWQLKNMQTPITYENWANIPTRIKTDYEKALDQVKLGERVTLFIGISGTSTGKHFNLPELEGKESGTYSCFLQNGQPVMEKLNPVQFNLQSGVLNNGTCSSGRCPKQR